MHKIVLHLLNGTTIEVPRKSIVHFVQGQTYETFVFMGHNGASDTTKRVLNTKLVIDKNKLAASQNTILDAIDQLKNNRVYKYTVYKVSTYSEAYVPVGNTVDGEYMDSRQILEDEGETLTLKLVN